VLIVSDNSLVSDGLAKRCASKRLDGTPVHLGWAASPAAVRHTLTEFFLMTRCSAIHQWSVYGGSGFSEIVAKIYDVPLYKVA
jgi:hypothetical protein